MLLKPGSDRRSHVVVRGRPDGQIGAADYATRRAQLLGVVTDELASLRADFDVVICEGAGSIAEINLRGSDIANMGLAQAASMPVIVVSDIDRGGSLAHLFGTTAVLDADDQSLVAGYLINKFRGDPGCSHRAWTSCVRSPADHLRCGAVRLRNLDRRRGFSVGRRRSQGRPGVPTTVVGSG